MQVVILERPLIPEAVTEEDIQQDQCPLEVPRSGNRRRRTALSLNIV